MRFLQALKLFGKDWHKVESFVSTRTSAQIRSHAQKYFNKLCKKGNLRDLAMFDALLSGKRRAGELGDEDFEYAPMSKTK